MSCNDLGSGAAAAGVVVADGGAGATGIAITPPGSAADGAGLVMIFCHEEASTALFNLNGSAGATGEVSDLSGIFTNTFDTAASINVFWHASTSSYRIQNRRGANRTFIVTYLGR